jgi:glycine cleavage system aminomethyltransferase T
MHVLIGQDTDSESNALEASMPWIVKFEKDEFVGKWALEHVRAGGLRDRLVGFELANGVVPPEGGAVVVDGRLAGRVTSARYSEELGRTIGLAWVPERLAVEDAEIALRVRSGLERASVRLRPFFDPDGERLRS